MRAMLVTVPMGGKKEDPKHSAVFQFTGKKMDMCAEGHGYLAATHGKSSWQITDPKFRAIKECSLLFCSSRTTKSFFFAP